MAGKNHVWAALLSLEALTQALYNSAKVANLPMNCREIDRLIPCDRFFLYKKLINFQIYP